MPNDDYAKDPKMRTAVHAAAKRGHAAMFVQRNTKNCEAWRAWMSLIVINCLNFFYGITVSVINCYDNCSVHWQCMSQTFASHLPYILVHVVHVISSQIWSNPASTPLRWRRRSVVCWPRTNSRIGWSSSFRPDIYHGKTWEKHIKTWKYCIFHRLNKPKKCMKHGGLRKVYGKHLEDVWSLKHHIFGYFRDWAR